MGLNGDAILKQINAITGTQDYPSSLNSITCGTQDDPSTLTSRTGDANKSSNVTPHKVHGKNLVTSYTLQRYPIHQREISEPHVDIHHYTGSDNSYTDNSHNEENIENYESVDELSNKDKIDAEDPE